jgi:hypothetical protein
VALICGAEEKYNVALSLNLLLSLGCLSRHSYFNSYLTPYFKPTSFFLKCNVALSLNLLLSLGGLSRHSYFDSYLTSYFKPTSFFSFIMNGNCHGFENREDNRIVFSGGCKRGLTLNGES